MVECTVQQPSYGSPYALDFCQSAIDTIHYALPFLRLNGDEARFSGHQLQTENGRGSCGGHTREAIRRKNYISLQAILQRSGAMANV